jgi:hypothetical protein
MSRERLNRLGSSMAAVKASAVSWPTAGIVIRRRQASDARASRFMSPSIATMALSTASRACNFRRASTSRHAGAGTWKLRPVLERSNRWGRIKAEVVCAMTSKRPLCCHCGADPCRSPEKSNHPLPNVEKGRNSGADSFPVRISDDDNKHYRRY